MDTEQSNLVEEREAVYGDAHYLSGKVIEVLREPFIKLVLEHPELVHNWVLMLSKLVRMLFSPTKVDHYDDISGYALLSKHILERSNSAKSKYKLQKQSQRRR